MGKFNKIITATLILLICIPEIFAQNTPNNFQLGISEYQKSQFRNAELHFIQALNDPNSTNLAQIFKMLAISQYMLGKKGIAANNFQSGLRINPKLFISPLEVLDDSIIEFFKIQKAQFLRSRQQVRQRPSRQQQPRSQIRNKPRKLSKPQQDPMQLTEDDAIKPKSKKSRPRSKRRKKSKGSRKISFFHFMPFGAPQFYNEKYFAGSIILLTQFGSIAAYMNAKNNIDLQLADIKTLDGPEYTDAQREQFKSQSKPYINEQEKVQKYASYALVGIWLVSSIEGIVNAPRSKKERSSKLTTSRTEPVFSFNQKTGKLSAFLTYTKKF